MTDTSRPQVRAWPWLRGYQGHFRKPGGRWQFVRNASGKAEVFPTSEAAKDAATAIIFRFMCPEIVAERAPDLDPIERKVADEFAEFRQRRADEDRRLRTETLTMHKAGRKPVVVETKRRSA